MAAISIGMPVYNGELFVREALECLTGQSFGDFELIVSDDCSTDGTLAIVEAFAAQDPRIRVIRQARNLGGAANYRVVLDAATAEYFMWFDQDDWVEPNHLGALHGVLAADPQKTLAVFTIIRKRARSLRRPWDRSIRAWLQDPAEARRHYFPDLPQRPRVWRVIRLLRAVRAAWIYGLFRTADLPRAFARAADEFVYVKSMFNLTVLPFLLNDRVAGTNETAINKRGYRTERAQDGITKLLAGLEKVLGADYSHSSKRLWTRTLGMRYHFAATFFLYCLRELFESRLALWEKLVCVPVLLLAYTSRAGHEGGNFKRLILDTMAWPVRRVWLLATGRELLG